MPYQELLLSPSPTFLDEVVSKAVINSKRPNHISIDVNIKEGVPIDAQVFDGPYSLMSDRIS